MTSKNKNERETEVQRLKLLFAAHHFVFVSQDVDEIARVVNLKVDTLRKRMTTDEFLDALAFWNYSPAEGDLPKTESLWTEMIKNEEHIAVIEYPETPLFDRNLYQTPDTYALIQSHLFCVDGLCEEQIPTPR